MILAGIPVIYEDEVPSTQDVALRFLQEGRTLPFLMMAGHQTKGRGRVGRVWESPIGNFFGTLAWPISASSDAGDFSFITAAALHRAISSLLVNAQSLKIKWPNDLMIDGLKCSGILLERPDEGSILIGTGVNLAYAPEGKSCLLQHIAKPVSPIEFAEIYLRAFQDFANLYQAEGLQPVLSYWRVHGYPLGGKMTVTLPHETFTAIYDGIEANGALKARIESGEVRLIHAGDVFFP